jgi:hypothetical protein
MHRCLIFLASLFLAFLAISSASTASPSEWKRVATGSASSFAETDGSADQASWMTVPSPGLATFVLIHL